MELIDRQALIDAIEEINWYHISLQGNLAPGARSDIHTPLYKADDIYEALNNAPTVDAVPVVHGEWVVCGDGENVPWVCSHCGKTTAHKYKVMYGNYCPNCGAKMDGGAE